MKKEHAWLVSYTAKGGALCRRAAAVLEEAGYVCRYLEKPRGGDWMKKAWQEAQVLLFVGAAGIAVRLAAPYVKDKMTDPALLVMDEKGQFVIPLLSSHAGGGAALARLLAEKLGACPVLTTATDVEQLFAVDVFAWENGLVLGERELAKEISAALLEGKKVGFYSELPVEGQPPGELAWCRGREELSGFSLGILVSGQGSPGSLTGESSQESPGNRTGEGSRILVLSPRNVSVGMGCKKGVSLEKTKAFYQETLEKAGISREQVTALSSIDLKKDEAAFLELARDEGIPFRTWTREELSKIQEVSEESDFVRETTGVGNVCERAALLGCGRGAGKLILPRQKGEGLTIALAVEERSVRFG